jgi:hypothetical protein
LINNPALQWRPRDEKAPIIHKETENTILKWLEGTGRLMEREITPTTLISNEDDLTNSLLETDDTDYDDDDLVNGDDDD